MGGASHAAQVIELVEEHLINRQRIFVICIPWANCWINRVRSTLVS
jgi:hypothetical protein